MKTKDHGQSPNNRNRRKISERPGDAETSARTSTRSAVLNAGCDCAICKGPLATQVDQFLYHNTFIPWKLTETAKQKSPPLKHPLKNAYGMLLYYLGEEFRTKRADKTNSEADELLVGKKKKASG